MTADPYRLVDREHRRRVVVAEAARVRDALRDTERFYHVAAGQIGSSQEIVDALTSCIEELSP